MTEFKWNCAETNHVPPGIPLLIAWKYKTLEEGSKQRIDVGIAFEGNFMSVANNNQGPVEDIAYWFAVPHLPCCDDCQMPADTLGIVIGTSTNERLVCAECAKRYLPCAYCGDLIHEAGLIPVDDDYGETVKICYGCYVDLES